MKRSWRVKTFVKLDARALPKYLLSPQHKALAQHRIPSSLVTPHHISAHTSANMVNISEVKGNAREARTAAHTHIKGLGLRSDGYAEESSNGFIGQRAAREVRPSQDSTYLSILTAMFW